MLSSNLLSPLQQLLHNEELTNPFEDQSFINYPNGIKKIIYGSETSCTYSEKQVFKIPIDVGYLAKISLRFTFLSTATTAKPFLAKRICQYIYLETVRGSRTIQSIRPEYTTSRIDNENNDTTSYYNNIMDINIPSSEYVCYNQLYFYFSERSDLFIDLRSVEPLQLHIVINDNYTLMGLDGDISSLKVVPIYEIIECNMPKLNKRYLAYDTAYEKAQTMINGSVSTTFDITIKRSVYNMHLLIKSTSQDYIRINSFIMYSNDKELLRYDRKLAYDPWTKELNLETNNTLTYWFSMDRDRLNNKFYLNLYNLRPLKIVLNHESIPSIDYKLYVLFEYPVLTSIDNGQIERIENY